MTSCGEPRARRFDGVGVVPFKLVILRRTLEEETEEGAALDDGAREILLTERWGGGSSWPSVKLASVSVYPV